jgi:hypothetical protein
LLDDLGVDLEAMQSNMNDSPFLGSSATSMYAFPGPDGHAKVSGPWVEMMLGIGDYESAVRDLPLPLSEQDVLIELLSGDVDYLEDLSLSEKSAYIESVSYAEFLTEKVGLSTEYCSGLRLPGSVSWKRSISAAPAFREWAGSASWASSLSKALWRVPNPCIFPMAMRLSPDYWSIN